MMKLNWILKKFEELTPYELYNIMWLRNEVFVVEQNCVYQDADYKDQKGWHLMGVDEEGKLMAYVRLLPVGVSYENEPSIGRVVTNPAARGTGVGRQLMLIISIPKGENLDKLNPKTTQNNPRVDEWNALMKKYQSGIEGAKPDETWIFLNKVETK